MRNNNEDIWSNDDNHQIVDIIQKLKNHANFDGEDNQQNLNILSP